MSLVEGAPIHVDYDHLPERHVERIRAKGGLTSREATYICWKITKLSKDRCVIPAHIEVRTYH